MLLRFMFNFMYIVLYIKVSRPGKNLIKFLPPAKMWLIYAKKWQYKFFFFCNTKIATTGLTVQESFITFLFKTEMESGRSSPFLILQFPIKALKDIKHDLATLWYLFNTFLSSWARIEISQCVEGGGTIVILVISRRVATKRDLSICCWFLCVISWT